VQEPTDAIVDAHATAVLSSTDFPHPTHHTVAAMEIGEEAEHGCHEEEGQ